MQEYFLKIRVFSINPSAHKGMQKKSVTSNIWKQNSEFPWAVTVITGQRALQYFLSHRLQNFSPDDALQNKGKLVTFIRVWK